MVVISGPSGVGKDALLLRLRELNEAFHFVVTATSRPPRPTEEWEGGAVGVWLGSRGAVRKAAAPRGKVFFDLHHQP